MSDIFNCDVYTACGNIFMTNIINTSFCDTLIIEQFSIRKLFPVKHSFSSNDKIAGGKHIAQHSRPKQNTYVIVRLMERKPEQKMKLKSL